MRNSFESNLFDDATVLKIAEQLGVPIRVKNNEKEGKRKVKISSNELRRAKKLKGGFVKYAHRVWSLTKEGEQYFLNRLEDEE